MPTLRKIILSLCSLVYHVLGENWHLHNLTMDDLFLKKLNGELELKVLLSDVRKGITQQKKDSTWKHVKDIINCCFSVNKVELSVETRRFCNFIGRQTKDFPLEKYPDSWTDSDKVAYLRLILQADMNDMKSSVMASGIVWPTGHDGAIQPILEKIINHDKKAAKYESHPWHYIRLARNVTKSFDLPESLKKTLKVESDFLRKMEEWTPTIWTDLYETIGPLGLK
ncbi:uncharacterized protein [Lolium perenne]|uniref:uncharacterized protein n=1 Tax=Lolium perenne TaxID=4522 RepID=UPI0021F5BE4E|nr:uncharacterized protein LOC127314193 [Lolium perenne]